MLELTANPNIILPGMLAVIASGLTSSELFGKRSIYLSLIHARGLDYRNDPRTQSLRRVGVAGIMERNFVELDRECSREQAMNALATNPVWIVVNEPDGPTALLPPLDLQRHLDDCDDTMIDLQAIPALRRGLAPIHFQATLQEAEQTLAETGADALFVWRMRAPMIRGIRGVLTRDTLESAPLR